MLSPCWILSELRELGQAVVSAVTCFLCLGPVLSAIGIAFLVSTASDSRSATISAFNSAASAWSAGGGAAAFGAASGAAFTLTGPAGASSALSLNQVTSLDSYTTPDLQLPNSTLRFYAAVSGGRPFSSTSGPDTSVSITLSRSTTGGSSSLTAPLFKTFATTISCKNTEDDTTCRSRCSGGYWTRNFPSTCTKYLKLSGICAVVDPVTGQLDAAGGSGCALINSDYSTFAGGSGGTKSVLGVFSFVSQATTWGASDFTGMPVTVRARTDPYVVLLRSTNGSMELDISVATKGAIGGALLAVGIVITFLTCLSIYFLIRCCKRRNGVQQQGQVIDAGGMGGAPPPPATYAVQYGGGVSKEQQMMQQQQQGGYAVQMQGPPMGYAPQAVAGGFAGPLPPQQVAYSQPGYPQQQQYAQQMQYAPQQMPQQQMQYAQPQMQVYAQPQMPYGQPQQMQPGYGLPQYQQQQPPAGYAYPQQQMR